jgi:hypothetical protein
MKKYIFINTYLHNLGFTPTGVIIYDETTKQMGFGYHDEYIQNNYPPINPATLNWRVDKKSNFIFDELDKTFLELLPTESDWSYKVLLAKYPEYEYMNLIEKLFFLESRTVGGLQCHLDFCEDEESIKGADWLEKIYESSIDFYQNYIPNIPYLHAFLPLTTYGGVRPKCMYEDTDKLLWIAKFNTPDDDCNFAKMEKVCLDMASDLDLVVAESNILTIDKTDIFLSKRFDKQGDKRHHSIPFLSLLNKEISNKNISKSPSIVKDLIQYSDFQNLDTILLVQKFLLDIAVNNTDNHLRNIRLILNDNHLWQIAPLFDVTMTPYITEFVYNPSNLKLSETYLENPLLAKNLAETFNVPIKTVQTMIDKTIVVANNFLHYCQKNNANEQDIEFIERAISIGLNKDVNLSKSIKTEKKHTLKLKRQ